MGHGTFGALNLKLTFPKDNVNKNTSYENGIIPFKRDISIASLSLRKLYKIYASTVATKIKTKQWTLWFRGRNKYQLFWVQSFNLNSITIITTNLVLIYLIDVTGERLYTVGPVTEFAGTRYYTQWTIHLMTHLIVPFKDGGLTAKLTENLHRVKSNIHCQWTIFK